MYRMALVDELGLVQFWCVDLTEEEIKALLEEFPEWTKKAIKIC